MIRKFSDNGTPYHEPPYTDDEIADMERRVSDGPVAFTRPTSEGENKIAYSPYDAAKAVGISVRSIFKEIAAGRLEARKPTRKRTLISADSLKAWLANLPTRTEVDALTRPAGSSAASAAAGRGKQSRAVQRRPGKPSGGR